MSEQSEEQGTRRVYKRQGIVHVCWAGQLWAPAGGAKTLVEPGAEVRVKVREPSGLSLLVAAAGKRSGELWQPIDIPAGKRRPTASMTAAAARSRAPLAVFLPKGFEPVMLACEAAMLAARSIAELGIPEELWDDQGWGAVHSRRTLLGVGRVRHDGTYERAA